jgi:hypothetical protein
LSNTVTKSGTANFISTESGDIILPSASATTSYHIWGGASWDEAGAVTSTIPGTPVEMFEMAGGSAGADRQNAAIYYVTGSTATNHDFSSLATVNAANVGGAVEVIEETAPGEEAPGYTTENLYGVTGPAGSGTGVDSTGTYWSAKTRGLCTGGRYYKTASTPTGAGTIKLWSGAGAELASAGFTVGAGDANSAWYEVLFSTPIAITPFTQYVISTSYFSSYYNVDVPFASQTISGNLRDMSSQFHATANTFPVTDVGNKYWVDVLFAAGPISYNRWG